MDYRGPFPLKKNPGTKAQPSKHVTYGKIGDDPNVSAEYLDTVERDVSMTCHELDKVNVQASRIISKFGGSYRLEKALQIANPLNQKHWRCGSSIYRWTYSRRRNGTGGLIPSEMIEPIMRAARYWGVFLDDSDFLIRLREKKLSPKQLRYINRMHLKKRARRMGGEPDEECRPRMLGNKFAHKDASKYDEIAEDMDKKENEKCLEFDLEVVKEESS